MLLENDIPYLDPMWQWLRKDETLKDEFTQKSFFMPHNNLISATEEAMRTNCPAPRALWILPQDTLASSTGNNGTCLSPGIHTFYIEIIVQCIRDPFQISEDGDGIKLTGQFMELVGLRKLVKKSISNFSKNYKANTPAPKFDNIIWKKDSMLYPSEETNRFLATAIQFDVKIF